MTGGKRIAQRRHYKLKKKNLFLLIQQEHFRRFFDEKSAKGEKDCTKTTLKPDEEKCCSRLDTKWTTWELLGDLCVATWRPLWEHVETR